MTFQILNIPVDFLDKINKYSSLTKHTIFTVMISLFWLISSSIPVYVIFFAVSHRKIPLSNALFYHHKQNCYFSLNSMVFEKLKCLEIFEEQDTDSKTGKYLLQLRHKTNKIKTTYSRNKQYFVYYIQIENRSFIKKHKIK